MAISTDTRPTVHGLRCEYLNNPLGIDIQVPRLSWLVTCTKRGARQTAYQVQVAEQASALEREAGLLWDTGKTISDSTCHIEYKGTHLRSGQRCHWRVKIWDQDDHPSDWSEAAWWEMAILDPLVWRAKWIEPDWEEDAAVSQPCPYLRQGFDLNPDVAEARIYVTAHGVYELSINGQRVGDDVFAPGFTAYERRLQYQTYDVTSMLRPGANAIGVILGDGWWRGKVGAASVRNTYGSRLALLLQMRVVYSDGSDEWLISDENWKSTTGPILQSDMKDGETYDARLEIPEWDTPGYAPSKWNGVRIFNYGYANLVAANSVPVRRHEELHPVAIIKTPDGHTVVDMGQNFAGRIRLKVQGPAGTVIQLQHGEMLDQAGNFTMKNLVLNTGTASDTVRQQDHYILKGGAEEVYEPRFTFHGFRYVLVEGFPGDPTPDNFTGIALYSDMPQTGEFTCSDSMVNQLLSNVRWSQKSNFLDIPTDCPQRERAGWTGDAQVFCRTGSTLMDTAAFFTKWLHDLAAEQHNDGLVTNLVPNAFRKAGWMYAAMEGSSGWGDAAVIIPWTMYQVYGDVRILEQQYASMKAWVDYEARTASHVPLRKKLAPAMWFDSNRQERQQYIWDTRYQWGEWLEPGTTATAVVLGVLRAMTLGDPSVATAYMAYSSQLLSRIATILGKREDAKQYSDFTDKVKKAWVSEFVSADGRLQPDKQATYVRAVMFDLLPADKRPAAVQRLVDLIRQNGNHLSTGFLATQYICQVLSHYGHTDVAYELLNQKSMPSWLYPITKGATSIWESWDSIRPDGKLGGLSSLNHYSFGAVAGWLFQWVAGIDLDPDEPAYRHVIIRPVPGGGLSYARATYQSIRGQIGSGWQITDDRMYLDVEIPANTHATVYLPRAKPDQVTESHIPLAQADGVGNIRQEGTGTICETGSGKYSFEYELI